MLGPITAKVMWTLNIYDVSSLRSNMADTYEYANLDLSHVNKMPFNRLFCDRTFFCCLKHPRT